MSIAQRISSLVTTAMLGAQYNLINGKVVESHAGNLATFAIKNLAGNDPSATDPVSCRFPDASVLTITAPLSFTPPLSTYGPGYISVANKAFRLWIVLINDAGTARIGLFVSCRNDGQGILSFDSRGVTNVVVPVGAQAGQVASSVAGSDKPYRVIAFADYESGLPTASTWSVSPARIMLVGPGSSLPGDVIQRRFFQTNAQLLNQSGTAMASNLVIVINSSSVFSAFQVQVTTDTYQVASAAAETFQFRILRNGTAVTWFHQGSGWAATVVYGQDIAITYLDFPFLAGNITYQLYFNLTQNGTNAVYCPWVGGEILVHEIMT